MREYQDIQVLRGVSHVVSPRDPGSGLLLSEAEFPLDDAVGDFLRSHVASGLQDPQAQAARFIVRDADRSADICQRILRGPTDLVDLSTLLARRLYEIALSDQRQKDGTFVSLVCAVAAPTQASFIALLKLDPLDAFQTVTDADPVTGKKRNRFAVEHNVLPTKGERLQKCAFIQTVDPSAEYELLVVDRLREGATVGRFWLTDFLGAEPILDAADRTRRLYRALKTARNQVEQDLTGTELAALDQVIAGTVVQRVVNLDTLVDALPVPEPARTQIAAVLGAALPDREFQLDPQTARQFIRRRRFQADNGVNLSVPDEFATMINVEDIDPDPRDVNGRLRRVSFETRTWKEG